MLSQATLQERNNYSLTTNALQVILVVQHCDKLNLLFKLTVKCFLYQETQHHSFHFLVELAVTVDN